MEKPYVQFHNGHSEQAVVSPASVNDHVYVMYALLSGGLGEVEQATHFLPASVSPLQRGRRLLGATFAPVSPSAAVAVAVARPIGRDTD